MWSSICGLANTGNNFNFPGCVFFISHICLVSREGVRNCTSLLLLTVLESKQNASWHLCGLFWRICGTKDVAFKRRSLSCKWEEKNDEDTCIDSYRESWFLSALKLLSWETSCWNPVLCSQMTVSLITARWN